MIRNRYSGGLPWALRSLVGLSALGGVWVWAQLASQPIEVSTLLPSGAAVVVETANAKGLLSEWNTSSQKQEWLKGELYQTFSRSRLFYRLQEASDEFGRAAGVTVNETLLENLLGSATGVALYDAGAVDFVLVSQMSDAQFTASSLAGLRATALSRSVAGTTFYVKRDAASNRVAAFAFAKGHLILSTNEDRMAEAIRLLQAAPNLPSVARDAWYQAAKASTGRPGEVRMSLNMPTLLALPHFQSYWLFGNRDQLKSFESAVCDFTRQGNLWRESRVMRKKPELVSTASTTNTTALLASSIPTDAPFYRLISDGSAGAAASWLAARLAGGNTSADPTRETALSSYAYYDVGSETELERFIDRAPEPSTATGSSLIPELRDSLERSRLAGFAFVLGVGKEPNAVFHQTPWALALASSADWQDSEWRTKIAKLAGDSFANQPVLFQARNGIWASVGLQPLFVAKKDKLLLLANDEALLRNMLRGPGITIAAPNTSYVAGLQHTAQRGPLFAMLRQIERPFAPDPVPGQPVEPRFLTGVMGNLSRMFAGVGQMQVVREDRGDRLFEQVTYQWAQ